MFINFRERERDRERARNIDVRETQRLVATCMHPDCRLNLQPGHVPYSLIGNWTGDLLVDKRMLQLTEQHCPGTWSFIYLFIFYCCSSTVVYFHPTMVLCPIHPHLPHSNLLLSALSMCPSYIFFDGPRHPIIPYYPSTRSSLITVNLFFISIFLVVFFFLIRLHL